MQIPSIRNFVSSPIDYFLESSWQGKTVQVLGVVALFGLIYHIAFRNKTSTQGTLPTPLSGRVDNQSQVEETPKGPDAPSTDPTGGAQTQSKLPKVVHSYIHTRVDPDLMKFPESEFGKWLSFKREDLSEWSKWASIKLQEGFCYQALKKFIPEFKEQVNKMIPVFEVHGVKKQDGGVFLQKCNEAVIGQKTDLLKFCTELEGHFDTLQSWDTALHKMKKAQLVEKLNDVNICPHYEFTNLKTEYFHYLGLHTQDDFTRLVSANITHLEAYGLRGMDDIDCLELRAMQPSIERLRQLVCSWTIYGDEKAHSPILGGVSKEQEGLSLSEFQSRKGESVKEETLHSRIEKEIKQCREVLEISNKLSDALNNDQDGQNLKKTVKLLNELFDELSRNLANGLDLLKKIENNDITRQLILLKGYINQYGQKAKWEDLNAKYTFKLARFAKPIDTVSTFYRMGD